MSNCSKNHCRSSSSENAKTPCLSRCSVRSTTSLCLTEWYSHCHRVHRFPSAIRRTARVSSTENPPPMSATGPFARYRSRIPTVCSKVSAECASILSFPTRWRTAMAHAIRFEKPGGPEVLTWQTVEVGKPGQGQVRLRHTAVGLNYIDTYQRSGLYQMPLPSGLGSEGAGVVEEVGSGVSGLQQ